MLLPTIVTVVTLLALIALIVGVMFTGYGPPLLAKPKRLSRREQHVLAALADASFPRGGEPALSGTEAGLVAYMDDHMDSITRDKRTLLRLLLVFLECQGLIFGPHRRRFTRMTEEQQLATLQALSVSPIYFLRITQLSIRTLFCLAYMASPSVATAVGCTPNQRPFSRPEPEDDTAHRDNTQQPAVSAPVPEGTDTIIDTSPE